MSGSSTIRRLLRGAWWHRRVRGCRSAHGMARGAMFWMC